MEFFNILIFYAALNEKLKKIKFVDPCSNGIYFVSKLLTGQGDIECVGK